MSFTQNKRDVALCGAKSFGNIDLSHRTPKSPDLGHFFRCQEFFEACDKTNINGMLLVEPVVRPLKVGCVAIGFNAVDVVDEREIGWIGNEGNRDEAMDIDRLASSAAPQTDLRVSDTVNARSKDFSVASLWTIRTNSYSVKASYSSKTANFVEAGEFVDGSPFFNHWPDFRAEMLANNNTASRADQLAGGIQCP